MANTKNITEKGRKLYGQGEMDYDYVNDILFFKVKDREYDRSLEFENMVIDVDSKNFITGIQIFDASEFLQISKVNLRQIPSWKFQAYIEDGKIEVRLTFQVNLRNKILERSPIIIQKNESNLPNSEMICVTDKV